jgi:hypothetical protein
MTINQLLASSLTGGPNMLGMTLGDFSDADMLVRPVPTANHAAWQLGHRVKAAHGMLSQVGAPLAPLPDGFKEKYTNDTCKSDDPAKFGTKAELLGMLTQINQSAAAWVKNLPAADFDKPGPEPMRQICPTVGDVLSLQAAHIGMHMGQFQVIRRKLGKPVMF